MKPSSDDIEIYDDIIRLPRHILTTRPHMSQHSRAAQFLPFAALTGFDDEIRETARLTDERLENDDYGAARLDDCLRILTEYEQERPMISVTFFKADEKKSGGEYVTAEGEFRRLDESENTVVFTDGLRIPIGDIYLIKGEIFDVLDENEF